MGKRSRARNRTGKMSKSKAFTILGKIMDYISWFEPGTKLTSDQSRYIKNKIVLIRKAKKIVKLEKGGFFDMF